VKRKLPVVLGLTLTTVATVVVLWSLTRAPAQPPAKSRVSTAEAQDNRADTQALARRVNALQDEVVRLRAESRAVASAPLVGAAPGEPADSAHAQRPMTPEEEAQHDAVLEQFYADLYAADVPDPGAARPFESSIAEAVAATGHSVLKSVECRATVCRLELKHTDPSGRARFYELAYGPLKYGWHFDASKTASDETIAIVGMPGHALPQLPL
jgi:hypothetical protein